MTKYAVDHGQEGWAVYDRGTGRAVRIDGRLQNDLPFEDATALAVTLNRIAERRAGNSVRLVEPTEDERAAEEAELPAVNMAGWLRR